MEYPLIISGEQPGTLRLWQDGLFTVFEAQCTHVDGVLRISVYGQGREGYLGVMQPWSGGMYFKRKMSKSELKDFPETIEYAAPSGLSIPSPEKTEEKREDEHIVLHIDSPPVHEAENDIPSNTEDLTWFRRVDGSLVSHDGKSCIVALPSKLRGSAEGTVIKEIEGGLYMLFRY